MIAIVMSGGANRGAREAGALEALFQAGIKPQILVGTSAGAINAAWIATDPTLDGARRLASMWTQARREDFFPGDWSTVLWRVLRGQSLFSSDALRRSLERGFPPDKRRFGDLSGVKSYITAANLTTSTLYLYGDQPEAMLIDAIMASTAHPLAYPPIRFGNHQLVDGGVIANVPVGIAVERGATEVYILNVGHTGKEVANSGNVFQVLNQSISMMMYQHFLMDLKYILENTDVVLHHIPITGFEDSAMWELKCAGDMVKSGRKAAEEYLRAPRGLDSVPAAVYSESQQQPPAGAEIYIPTYFTPSDMLTLPQPERQITRYLTRAGASDPATIAQAIGKTPAQIRIDLASLIKKGIVQHLPDGRVRLVFGKTRRRQMPDGLWEALTADS